MTSGCTVEAHHFRDDKSLYDAANTVVLGVSMDPKEMHQQFTEKDSLNFPLLVDVTGKIVGDYGVPASENRYPKRWTFLIGKDGKIAKVYHKVDPRVHSQELLKDIAELNAKH
jgi:peroxiredoxin Q/BCP